MLWSGQSFRKYLRVEEKNGEIHDINEGNWVMLFTVLLFGKTCLPPAGVEGVLLERTCYVKSCLERPKSLLIARPSTTFPSKTNSRESSRKWMKEKTKQKTRLM